MSAGRRSLLLSAVFVGAAAWLCPTPRAHAQFPQQFDSGPGKHQIWNNQLSPEQIRNLLTRFGQGDNEATKQIEDAIRDRVKRTNPKAAEDQERLDAAIKEAMKDKELMNRLMDMAQKYKNENPNDQFKITPEVTEKLKKLRPNGKGGDPFQMPKEVPPFDPKNFDPEQFPHLDPGNPPKPDPKTGRLVNPKDGKAIDPRTGQPAGPNVKQKDPPVPPKKGGNTPKGGDPMNPQPPGGDPHAERPPEPPPPEQKPRFDPNNPLGAPPESPEKAARTKAAETATALWERNVGPIDESPAVRKAIIDLVSDREAMDALTDGKGNSIFDAFRDVGDGGSGLDNLFGGGDGNGGGWDLPKLDFKFDWGKGSGQNVDVGESGGGGRRTRWPDTSSSGRSGGSGGSSMGGMGSFNFGGMQVPWLLALILLAMVVAAVVWWKWQALFPPQDAGAFGANGVGAWPVDPREISTREDIVKAFEYLSVLICGPGAKTWTHSTIADELTALAATHGETAVKLARLYELARYAPLDEPLTRAEILEARRLACDLAGVDEA